MDPEMLILSGLQSQIDTGKTWESLNTPGNSWNPRRESHRWDGSIAWSIKLLCIRYSITWEILEK